jgi:hypothetical protein
MTLRLILRLDRPDRGTAQIGGRRYGQLRDLLLTGIADVSRMRQVLTDQAPK